MSTINTLTPAAAKPAGEMDEHSKSKLQKAVREFESMIVGYMLKSMRSSMSENEMFGDSFGGDVLEGMFDLELAKQMSRSSSFGLGEMLYRKMTGEDLPQTHRTGPVHTAAPVQTPGKPVAAKASEERNVTEIVPSMSAAKQPSTPASVPATVATVSTVPVAAPVTRLPAVAAPATASPVRSGEAASPVATQTKVTAAKSSGVTPLPLRTEKKPVLPAVHRQPADTVDKRIASLSTIIDEASKKHGVDANLLRAIIAGESGGNAAAQSPRNAKGLMQLVDTTATAMGVKNVWDPKDNIHGGAKYLQSLLERFGGDVEQAVASYNAGPGAVEKHGGIPPFKETRDYVSRVMKYLQHFEQMGGGSNDQN